MASDTDALQPCRVFTTAIVRANVRANEYCDGQILAYSSGVADALRGLEFNLARDQDRLARFAAGFVCGDSLCHCPRRARACIRRPGFITTETRFRLHPARFYRAADVRPELSPAL